MAYGWKYIAEFDSIVDVPYTLQIWEKDYTGDQIRLNLAANPIIHKYNNDNPKEPIKASTLEINLLNEGNVTPIDTFLSNEDDTYLVYFLQGTDLLFKGYLVQDDFSELMVDYTHEVKLLATDNLGLLKDVSLDMTGIQATLPIFAATAVEGVDNFVYLYNIPNLVLIGTSFTITGHQDSGVNTTYTTLAVTNVGTNNYKVRVSNTVANLLTPRQCTVSLNSQINLNNNRYSIRDIVYACLNKAGLDIGFRVFCSLHEKYHRTDRSFFEQTYIDINTFRVGDGFDNCYNVLESILKRFKISLFQCLGLWHFVRWDDAKGVALNGYAYSPLFTYAGQVTLPTSLEFGFNESTAPLFGLTKYFHRPLKFVSEQFDYKQPQLLLKNSDLQSLGNLLRIITIGPNEIHKEYVATDWDGSYGAPPFEERFIRVVEDSLGEELDRYLVIKGVPVFDSVRIVQGVPVEVSKGDKVTFNFRVKTAFSSPELYYEIFAFALFDGTTTNYLNDTPIKGNWLTTFGWTHFIEYGDNSDTWQNVEMKSLPIPFDGVLLVYLGMQGDVLTSDSETRYKDIVLTLEDFVANSKIIKGHLHKDTQELTIKNVEELTIAVDDSPRNSIPGTLFAPLFKGILQVRCNDWNRIGNVGNEKLGQITTVDQLQYRSVTRYKLEGSFDGLKVGGTNISMLNTFNYTLFPTKMFVFGNLEFDYRNNIINNLTGWEVYDTDEVDIADAYTFKYLTEK
jgi:hypothetical protein